MKSGTKKPSIHTDLKAEEALFDGDISALVLTLYENERPPKGLAGILDWYCFGLISEGIRNGSLSGREGECSYFPFTRRDQTYHLFLVGGGTSEKPGDRQTFAPKLLNNIQKNLATSKFTQIGISKADFGGISEELLQKLFPGVPLWIAA